MRTMEIPFCKKAEELYDEIIEALYPIVYREGKIKFHLHYFDHVDSTIEILDDDDQTVFVRSKKFEERFIDLPLNMCASIADTIIRNDKNTKK